LIISVDVTDWRDEMQREEPRTIQTADDIIALVADDGYSMAEAGKVAVIQEEMGTTKIPVLASRKLMIANAARAQVNVIVASRKRMVETSAGKEYQAREFVAIPSTKASVDGDELDKVAISGMGESPVVSFDSDPGLNRCLYYLRHAVPGHIWGRLVQICGAGGDVVAIAEEVKANIDEMVGRLE